MLAQKQPPFKECVIAHWSSGGAPKMNGAKIRHRSDGLYLSTVVGEQSLRGEAESKGSVDLREERMLA